MPKYEIGESAPDYSKYANERVAMQTKFMIGIQSFLSVLLIALTQLVAQSYTAVANIIGYVLPLCPVTSVLLSMLGVYLFRKRFAVIRCKSDFKKLKASLAESIKSGEDELKSLTDENEIKDLQEVISDLKKRKNRLRTDEANELQKILSIGV